MSPDYQLPERMALKEKAIPLPDFKGKTVLDVGCDFGYWSFLAEERGAQFVTGIDRNREVRGERTDLVALNNAKAQDEKRRCAFVNMDLGKQYHDYGSYDVVFMFSMYHHAYQSAGGDHNPIWYWLKRSVKPGGVVIWENPVDSADAVVQLNVENRKGYTKGLILEAATRYFDAKYIGPALHEPFREVWEFRPKEDQQATFSAFVQKGEGGASQAFAYANGRRMREIATALGVKAIPGTVNLRSGIRFPWDECYFRAQMLDVLDREQGLNGGWAPRWMRYYPVTVNDTPCYALRFEGDEYAPDFLEVCSGERIALEKYAHEPWLNKVTREAALRVDVTLAK